MIYLLSFVFFLSGAAALIFEALWFQLLGLGLGNSIWASSIVLSSFMAGLAIGNGLAYAISLQIRRPDHMYAYLEYIIGLTGLAVVLLFPHLNAYLGGLFREFHDQTVITNILRGGISFSFLLVPATAMGATLPLLVKALYPKIKNFGQVLGILYGWNTFGAVLGVLVNEFYLVRLFGLTGSGLIAAFLNVTAATIVLIFLKTEIVHSRTDKQSRLFSISDHHSEVNRFLIVSFFTGLIILALEVFWLRFILLFFNAYSLNFTIMLAAVLSGISMGGLFASRWFRRNPNIHIYLPFVYLLMAVFVTLNYRIFDYLFTLTGKPGTEYEHISLALLYLCFVFPVTFLSGIAFTMIGKSLALKTIDETKATSLLTMANTTGGMIGALLGAFLMIPYCGIEKSFFISAAVFGLMASFSQYEAIHSKIKSIFARSSIAFTIILVLIIIFPFGKMNDVYLNFAVKNYLKSGEKRIAVKESLHETIQIFQKEFLGFPYYHRLVTNNYPMSNTKLYCKRYMKLFVYWPVAVLREPEDALLICYGCGTTAKALVDTKQLKNIDIVDLSEDIIALSENIYKLSSESPLNDPRVNIHIEDGRFFLLKSEKKYDLITAEPPPLRVKGVVNLYTKEYFQLIYDSLKDGGIVTYWLPVYQVNVSDAKSIVKGFSEVFENCSLWIGSGFDWMIVGMKSPDKLQPSDFFSNQWNTPGTAKEIKALGFPTPEQFGSLFIADGERLQKWIAGSLPLVDNYPYRLNKDYVVYLDESVPIYRDLMNKKDAQDNFITSEYIRKIWPKEMILEAEKYFDVRDPIVDYFVPGKYKVTDTVRLIDMVIRENKLHDYILWAFNIDDDKRKIVNKAQRSELNSPLIDAYKNLFKGANAIVQKDYRHAEQSLKRALESLESNDEYLRCSLIRIYLLFLLNDKAGMKEAISTYINYHENGGQYRAKQIQALAEIVRQNY